MPNDQPSHLGRQMDTSQPAVACSTNDKSKKRPPFRIMDIGFVGDNEDHPDSSDSSEPDTVAGATLRSPRVGPFTNNEAEAPVVAGGIDKIPQSAEEKDFWRYIDSRPAAGSGRRKSRFVEHTNSFGIYEDGDDVTTTRDVIDDVLAEEEELEEQEGEEDKENLHRGECPGIRGSTGGEEETTTDVRAEE
ncbi:MAG: hypothetical protein Q9220_002271 [cf. Caloplaca sp. 1 TL-2023]